MSAAFLMKSGGAGAPEAYGLHLWAFYPYEMCGNIVQGNQFSSDEFVDVTSESTLTYSPTILEVADSDIIGLLAPDGTVDSGLAETYLAQTAYSVDLDTNTEAYRTRTIVYEVGGAAYDFSSPIYYALYEDRIVAVCEMAISVQDDWIEEPDETESYYGREATITTYGWYVKYQGEGALLRATAEADAYSTEDAVTIKGAKFMCKYLGQSDTIAFGADTTE